MVLVRIGRGEALPYPGGHALLLEFPPERMPLGLVEQFFRMQVRGLRPVIAPPERYSPIWKSSEVLRELVERGAGVGIHAAGGGKPQFNAADGGD